MNHHRHRHGHRNDRNDPGDLDLDYDIPTGAYVEPTQFAGPYFSMFLDAIPQQAPLLQALNCSYFSTGDQAPTLLDLKQHAQALTVLIRQLTVARSDASIDGGNSTVSDRADTWDFLADLSVPYTNEDPLHNVALTGLMNMLPTSAIKSDHGRKTSQCPLHEIQLSDTKPETCTKPLPYATNWAMIRHANALLERLDHEFSAEGGILGMLPYKDGKDESLATNLLGRRSVLGQWIAFTRGIVSRHHELETNLNDLLNITAGEAVIPKMLQFENKPTSDQVAQLSKSDRFVINIDAGKQEALAAAFAEAERAPDLTDKQDDIPDRSNHNLLTVTVKTTYSRLRGGTTIFISPTDVEQVTRPGIIQAVKGEWRNQGSVWEQRNNAELQRLRLVESTAYVAAREEAAAMKEAIDALLRERQLYILYGGELHDLSEETKEQMRQDIWGDDYQAAKDELAFHQAELEKEEAVLERQRAELARAHTALERQREELPSR